MQDGEVIRATTPEVLTETLDSETVAQVKELMYAAGRNYGLSSAGEAPVGAKSGTAQINVELDRNHTYLIAFTDTCTVVVSRNNVPSNNYGVNLTGIMQSMLNRLG